MASWSGRAGVGVLVLEWASWSRCSGAGKGVPVLEWTFPIKASGILGWPPVGRQAWMLRVTCIRLNHTCIIVCTIHACLIATYVFFCGMPNQYLLGTIYWMLRVAHPPLFFTCASLGQCGRKFRREATKQLRATVSEVYSAPRVTATAGRNPRLGIMPGLALCSGRN